MSAVMMPRATPFEYASAMRSGHRVPAETLGQVLEILREAGDGWVLVKTLRCEPGCQCGSTEPSYELELIS